MTTKISNRRRASKNAAPVNAAPATVETPAPTETPAPIRPGYKSLACDFASIPALLRPYETRAASFDFTRKNARYMFFANMTLPGLSASDIPALLNLAASLLNAVGASIPNVAPLGFAATDPITATYYRGRNRHGDQSISDLDRMQTPATVAEMLIANIDRVRNTATRRAYDGGYNGGGPTATRIASLATTVAAMLTPATDSDDSITL